MDNRTIAKSHPDDLAARRWLMSALQRIAQLRRLSQTDIARRIRTSQSAVSEIFSHQKDIRLSTLQRLIRAVQVGYDIVLSSRWGEIRISALASQTRIWSPDLPGTVYFGHVIGPEHVRFRHMCERPSPQEVTFALQCAADSAAANPRDTISIRRVRMAHPADDPLYSDGGVAATLELIRLLERRPSLMARS